MSSTNHFAVPITPVKSLNCDNFRINPSFSINSAQLKTFPQSLSGWIEDCEDCVENRQFETTKSQNEGFRTWSGRWPTFDECHKFWRYQIHVQRSFLNMNKTVSWCFIPRILASERITIITISICPLSLQEKWTLLNSEACTAIPVLSIVRFVWMTSSWWFSASSRDSRRVCSHR